MYTNKILAVSAALLTVACAVPLHHKRDLVVVTKTQEVVVTIPVTRTVWLGAGETSATDAPTTSEQAALTSTTTSKIASPPPAVSSSPNAAPTSIAPVPQSSAPAPVPVSSKIAPVVSPVPVPEPTTQPSTSSTVPSSSVFTTSVAPAAPAPVASTADAAPSSAGSTTGVVDDVTHGPAAAGSAYVGDLTYYTPGMGACGIVNTDADHIVAISQDIFDVYTPNGNPNANPLCGQYVQITGLDGTVHTGQITDRCVGCDAGSLDLTEPFFNLVTNNGDGRVHNIHWQFASAT